MDLIDLKRKFKKGFALLTRFVKNPVLTYDDFIQFQFEKKNDIITRGMVSEPELGIPMVLEPFHYVPSGNIYLTRLLRSLKISNDDSIIDLGCGLGSAMIYMSKFSFFRISGIEYSKELFNGCQRNILNLSDSRLDVFYGDAGDFISYDSYNYIFMFNPFGSHVMQRVLENIFKSYIRCPRIITLIYKNPVYNEVILENGVFKKVSEFRTESNFNFIIYRTN